MVDLDHLLPQPLDLDGIMSSIPLGKQLLILPLMEKFIISSRLLTEDIHHIPLNQQNILLL